MANWEASDGLLLRLTEAEAGLKLPRAAAHIQTLAARFDAARLRGDTTHRAEEARFHLRLRGNATQATQLATENYRGQKSCGTPASRWKPHWRPVTPMRQGMFNNG